MAALYRVLERKDLTESDRDLFAREVLIGLSASSKSIPSRYFYDARGSELFNAITDQPEYYLTGCERQIFERHGDRIGAEMREGRFNLVELGAGDGRKTKILLERFLEAGLTFDYTPIDISEAAIQDLTRGLSKTHPDISVQGLVSEYFDGIKWIKRHTTVRNLILFLGSNIGNFTPVEADRFLISLWNAMRGGDMLYIGFDLKKSIDTLTHAYADAAGVTRDFNLNLLERINRELGGNFDLAKWQHVATYNFQADAMQSFLVSTEAQKVRIESLRRSFDFDPWESIHMESSYKYSHRYIESLAARSGFEVVEHLHDDRRWFCGSIWKAIKES